MKAAGIVRKVDNLGRIVIPKEIRNTYEFIENQELEFYVEGDTVILKKYQRSCIFCGEEDSDTLTALDGKLICGGCYERIVRIKHNSQRR